RRRHTRFDCDWSSDVCSSDLAVARDGVAVYPDGAFMWLILGRTLRRVPGLAAHGEIESCMRRSLSFNRSLFESADWLSMVLSERSEERRVGKECRSRGCAASL